MAGVLKDGMYGLNYEMHARFLNFCLTRGIFAATDPPTGPASKREKLDAWIDARTSAQLEALLRAFLKAQFRFEGE